MPLLNIDSKSAMNILNAKILFIISKPKKFTLYYVDQYNIISFEFWIIFLYILVYYILNILCKMFGSMLMKLDWTKTYFW